MATNHRSLDDIDLAIIDELVANPRRSYSNLAEPGGKRPNPASGT